MSEEVFLKEREAEQVQQRLESSTHHQQLEKLKELQKTIGEWVVVIFIKPHHLGIFSCVYKLCCAFVETAKAAVEQSKEAEKKAVAKCKEVQEKMKVRQIECCHVLSITAACAALLPTSWSVNISLEISLHKVQYIHSPCVFFQIY